MNQGKISLIFFGFIFFLIAFIFVSAIAFFFWQKIQKFEPNVYYYVPPERSFIFAPEDLKDFGIEEYIQEKITTEKNKLIKEKKSFIFVDLSEMKLTLYEEGKELQTFPIQSKGKVGSWWETAPGVYFVGEKVTNHFSSVSRVWMPYGVQFYGNFFIHGWPYYTSGKLLPPGPSGGCIRLKTEDAVIVFNFAQRGMPVLVFEKKPAGKDVPPLPALTMVDPKKTVLELKSEAVLIADLMTGEVLVDQEMEKEFYAGPITKAMLALTASEVVNLERTILARPWMIEGIGEGIIIPGKTYKANDILYPLLRQSSKEAAFLLSRFLTSEFFLTLMNVKAKAIGMNNTNFVDISGESKENITTLYDAARMARYIKDYRSFIFNISKPNKYFIDKENLEAVFAGPKVDGKESVFTVWNMKKNDDENQRIIFIGLADSANAQEDIEKLLSWLEESFDLK